MSARLKCEHCGGAVEYDARDQVAACLFCGVEALRLIEDEDFPDPDGYLPMRLSQAEADTAYRAWSRASWWRPKELRALKIEAKAVYLPAWRFVCEVDTHWAGLRRAATASGKAPTSGRESITMEHVVPASGGLEPEELWGLWPYDATQARPWQPDGTPHELPAKSQHRAAVEVHEQVRVRHRAKIGGREGLARTKSMSEVHDVDAKTLLLPVYVGVFRFRDQAWRFLINAQSGEVFGRAPIDRVKVTLVSLAVLALIVAGIAIAEST